MYICKIYQPCQMNICIKVQYGKKVTWCRCDLGIHEVTYTLSAKLLRNIG